VAGAVVVSGAFLALGVAVPALVDGTSADDLRLLRATAFESSYGLAVWWATTLFLLLSVLAYSEACRRSPDNPTVARCWRLLAAVFVWLSFDHATHLHVALTRIVSRAGAPSWVDPSVLVLALVAFGAAVPLWRDAAANRVQLVAAGSLVVLGGAGVDAVLAWSGSAPGTASRALEAACEWGGLVWLAALLISPRTWRRPPHAADSPGHVSRAS
jgi:hypothetical protein